jgi:hypothetical protein
MSPLDPLEPYKDRLSLAFQPPSKRVKGVR